MRLRVRQRRALAGLAGVVHAQPAAAHHWTACLGASLAAAIPRPVGARMTPRREKPETLRQRAIVFALRRAGHIVLRTHSGKVKVRGGWMQQNEEGTPDLHVVPSTYLETKTDDGKLSDVQRAMHEKLRRRGGVVAVVRSAAEALRAVMQEGCP
jgi:hypothetical protein